MSTWVCNIVAFAVSSIIIISPSIYIYIYMGAGTWVRMRGCGLWVSVGVGACVRLRVRVWINLIPISVEKATTQWIVRWRKTLSPLSPRKGRNHRRRHPRHRQLWPLNHTSLVSKVLNKKRGRDKNALSRRLQRREGDTVVEAKGGSGGREGSIYLRSILFPPGYLLYLN